MVSPGIEQLKARPEQLKAPASGALEVSDAGVTIRWGDYGCAIDANGREYRVDGSSDLSLQLSVWQSPSRLSWLRPGGPGPWWLGLEFYLSSAGGNGKRVRLKARISAEEAAELPRLELAHAVEVGRGELITAITAMRQCGAMLSKGTGGAVVEKGEDDVQNTATGASPVDFLLLAVLGVVSGVAGFMAMEREYESWMVLEAGLALAVMSMLQWRWVRLLHRRFGIPLESPAYASNIVPLYLSGFFVSLFIINFFTRGWNDLTLAFGHVVVIVLPFAVGYRLFAHKVREAAAKFRPERSEAAIRDPRSGQGVSGMRLLMLLMIVVLTYIGYLVTKSTGQWFYMVAALGLVALPVRHDQVASKMERENVWPDKQGPLGARLESESGRRFYRGQMFGRTLAIIVMMVLLLGIAIELGRDWAWYIGIPGILASWWVHEKTVVRELEQSRIPYFRMA